MEKSIREENNRIERSNKEKEHLKSMFNFSESDVKRGFVHQHRLDWKMRRSFNYLIGKLSENTPTTKPEDYKKSEGKNYDFYYFNCGEKLKIIIRTYRNHLTLFILNSPKDNLRKELSVFVVKEDSNQMTDELQEQFWEDPLMTFRKILPQIIEHGKEDNLWLLSNGSSLKLDPWTEIESVYTNNNPHNLDLLIFACDEIFNKYLMCFAENEVIERLKELKVGDKFGTCYEITGIVSELKNDYYHSVGLSTKRTDEFGMLHEKGDEFHDVYRLCRWKFDELFPMEDFKVNTPEIY